MQVARIASCKSHTSHIVETLHIIEVCIDMVAETIVVSCRMTYKAILDIVILHITPGNRHLTHIDNLEEFFLIAARTWHTECCLHIALSVKTSRYTVAGNSKTSVYLGREFPSEH